MASTSLEKKDQQQNCKFCTRTFKSKSGLQYHMQKMHPLDVDSGLSCFTCNKTFSKRDLIENHFKTVKHQLECKRLMKSDRVDMTTSEYRKRLFQIDNFTCRPYRKRKWESDETLDIPLEKEENLHISDPRLQREHKRIKTSQAQENRDRRDQAEATTQKAVITKFAEEFKTVNIEDLMVIEVATKAINTIGPVMFKVIEDTAKSTEIKVQQEGRQKNVKITTPIEEKGTDKNIYITSTPGNAEKMSSNTKLKEIAKSTKSTEIHTDTDQVEPPATSLQKTGARSTLEQDTVILQVTDEEDQEFPEELNNLITTLYPIDNEITETRKVYLNNDWQVTDTIGNPDFIGLIEDNSNMDLLSFITDKLPY